LVLFGLPFSHYPSQFVKYPSGSVKQIPYPQFHFLELKIPMFPIATYMKHIFHRDSEVQGVEDFLRHLRPLHFEILHYFFVEGLTSAAASGIGACAATLLLPASD
jgi:hypothetical protein